MYASGPAPRALAESFSSFATWTQATSDWFGILAADPGFEIAWTTTDGRLDGRPCLTPASRRPRLVTSSGGPRQIRILRLRPAFVGALLGGNAAELVDQRSIDLHDLGPGWRAAAHAKTEAELIEALSSQARGDVDPVARTSFARLRELPALPFPTLAAETGYSYAQWRRRMKAALGVSPKFLDRYLRLQRASRLAKRRPTMSMAEVAFRTGYASDCGLAAEASALSGRTFRGLVDGYTLPE